MNKTLKIILIISIGVIALFLITLTIINYQNQKNDLSCNWEPGLCKNICRSQNYYFDINSKECQQYVGSSCCTPPPFETLEECKNSCK